VAGEAVAEDEGCAEFVSLLITSMGVASGKLGITSVHAGPGAAPVVWSMAAAAAAAECFLLLAA